MTRIQRALEKRRRIRWRQRWLNHRRYVPDGMRPWYPWEVRNDR